MRSVVVYESMFGNTRQVAESIGRGLEPSGEVAVVPVDGADEALRGGVDLLVVGGPTHVHGLSSPRTRAAAVEMASKPESRFGLDEHASGPGLREWFGTLASGTARAAAFDTRMPQPAVFTGRASKRIRRELRRRGFDVSAPPESFIVDSSNVLKEGELERARAWGSSLVSSAGGATRPEAA